MASRAVEVAGDHLQMEADVRCEALPAIQWSFSHGFDTNAFILLII